MHTYARHSKMLRQMCSNGFDEFPPPPTGLEQDAWGLRLHPGPWRCDDGDSVALGQPRLSLGVNEAFVGGYHPPEVLHQGCQVVDVVGTGGQQRTLRDHTHA